ncbi:MetQ/NlpA family ABC transporter substrate-binding protein [Paenibacillus sp. MER TA 81-3]|uniref:MetQ/NlpA family ABC transporter substrate-binding protein n=1 Tax=Paenibacillus sp. MER TA 81-3 TaxID=2939573 RepID=UPI002041A4AA|nr:MetQ/NlpA family ABC transporter substrate-binding protein [Paenibacillus sp. MER TA 81-3]MCM3338931.1 MetQ/NlpA family ABC transporter substrate-binding protein [Paenibacillus sp. MER TA 81-3]
MKKWTYVLTLVTLVMVLAACGSKPAADNNATNASDNAGGETTKVVVGASPVPHAEILNHIKPLLKDQGIELEIKEFTDYVQPNVQVHEKQLDANFFQHKPYMDNEVNTKGYKLVSVGNVHVEPFGAYSKKIKSVDELQDGATVAIPNDATNGGRSLLLLEKQGIIKLKEGTGLEATARDVADNPKNLKFKELEAAMLPRALDEVDMALINTNYALQAELNPTKDALFIEDKDSPYANILTAREDNKDSEAIKKLVAALQSDNVKKFIEDKYKGAIVPAF